MVDSQSWTKRLEKYRASKTQIFWACAACAVATIVVGFTWGGWVTGASAREMAMKAAAEGRASVVAALCVDKFAKGADVGAKLVALKATDSWRRNEFIEKGGWVTLPGVEKPMAGAAEICAKRLLETDAQPMKTTGAAG